MGENPKYIKARVKTQGQIAMVHPPAVYWGKPIDERCCCGGRAEEVILPYLGKVVLVKKKRQGIFDFYYEIKDTDGLIVLPNWIAYFDSEHLVPPTEWEDIYNPSIVDDIWLNYEEDRIFFVDNLPIITG
jgi:hypothetical protein